MDGRLTVTLDENGKINAMQKAGPVGFKLDEIKKCINIASDKAAELRNIVLASE